MWSLSKSNKQGPTHLPHANLADTPGQVALVKGDLSTTQKTVLCTHFTFVSYKNQLAHVDAANPANPTRGMVGFSEAVPYGDFDFGTFNELRRDLFRIAADAKTVQCVLTGHSHRKAVYHIVDPGSDRAATEGWPMNGTVPGKIKAGEPPLANTVRTPVVVSDSAGPLPRMNLVGELQEWGSDVPSGTIVRTKDGKVESIEAVQATLASSRPRLAVALEYLQVLNDDRKTEHLRVFEKIESLLVLSRGRSMIFHRLCLLRSGPLPALGLIPGA